MRRGSGTQEATPRAPAARCCWSFAPRGSSTQWATTGPLDAHCGKERWSRKGKEPPTKPGRAEPRTTAQPLCSVNHLGHHAGAHTTRVNHNGAHATREAHTTRDHQGTRDAHVRPTEWWSAWGGWPVQRVEEWGTWASRTQKRSDTGCGRPKGGGAWAAKNVARPRQQPAEPRYANYWAPLTHKRYPPQPAQPQHTNHWALQTRKRHQQEHWPQRSTECSGPTQHAKGRTGDCPGPRKETATRRNVTQGVSCLRRVVYVNNNKPIHCCYAFQAPRLLACRV